MINSTKSSTDKPIFRWPPASVTRKRLTQAEFEPRQARHITQGDTILTDEHEWQSSGFIRPVKRLMLVSGVSVGRFRVRVTGMLRHNDKLVERSYWKRQVVWYARSLTWVD